MLFVVMVENQLEMCDAVPLVTMFDQPVGLPEDKHDDSGDHQGTTGPDGAGFVCAGGSFRIGCFSSVFEVSWHDVWCQVEAYGASTKNDRILKVKH
jgi:hypothetical protein